MAGRSWPSLTSDALEHEWIGVHQLRLDRKRRRRASLPMRPPYCLVIRLNVAGEPRPVEEWAGVVVAQEFLPHPPRKDLLIYGKSRHGRSDHASARTRPPLLPPSCAPRTALVHRSVAAAEYITDPMMQLVTSGNDQSESTSWLFIPIHG
jgi:hypothetical protein